MKINELVCYIAQPLSREGEASFFIIIIFYCYPFAFIIIYLLIHAPAHEFCIWGGGEKRGGGFKAPKKMLAHLKVKDTVGGQGCLPGLPSSF